MPRVFFIPLLCGIVLMGCDDDPSGIYVGAVNVATSTRTLTENFHSASGTGKARSTRGTASRAGARIQLSSMGEGRFELRLDDGCSLPLESLPGATTLRIPHAAAPTCPLPVDGIESAVPFVISGTATLDTEGTSLHLDFHGEFRRGNPDRAGFTTATSTWTFDGRRARD